MDILDNHEVIFGRYATLDLNESFVIKKELRYKFSYFVDKMIEAEINTLRKRYKHGYLSIDTVVDSTNITNALMIFRDIFFKFIEENLDLKQIFENTKKEIYKIQKKDENLTSVLNRLCIKLDAKIRLYDINRNDITILELKNAKMHHILELNSHIKAVFMNKKPNYLLLEILNKKDIFFHVNDNELIDGNSYYIHVNDRKVSVKKPKVDEIYPEINGKSGRFLLGLEVNNEEQIIKYQSLKPGFIMVEPEKSFLDTDGIGYQKIRESFYAKLYDTYPDTEIIITLPKHDILNEYHQVNNDFLLDYKMCSRHFVIYMKEINAIFSKKNKNIKINLPFIPSDELFLELKKAIQMIIKKRFGSKVKIGLDINLDLIVDYIDDYFKYDFAVIDTARLYEELDYEASELTLFTKEISSLNQRLKNKYKDIYIKGELINDGKYFQKLVSKGFKRFVVSFLQFKSFLKIIENYHDTRGRYAKFKENCSNNNIS